MPDVTARSAAFNRRLQKKVVPTEKTVKKSPVAAVEPSTPEKASEKKKKGDFNPRSQVIRDDV